MTFLPVVERELGVAARSAGTYRARGAMTLLAATIAAGSLLVARFSGSSVQTGGFLFSVLSLILLIFSIFEGIRVTSDCISQEKREGTLGLLFLTDLRGYDVVLGKLAATSLRVVYGILAVFPVLAISLTIGGVTPGEFWRRIFALLSTLGLTLAIGITVSALGRDSRKCLGATFGLVVSLMFVPLAASEALRVLGNPAHADWIRALSPLTAWLEAAQARYSFKASGYWLSLGFAQVIALVALAIASWWLPSAWQLSGRETERRERQVLKRATRRRPGRSQLRDRKWLDTNPALWLAARASQERTSIWVFLVLAYGIWLLAWAATSGSSALAPVGMAINWLVSWVLRVGVASQASLWPAEARRNGDFELLLATPLTTGEMLRGHRDAVIRVWKWPLIVTLVMQVLIAATTIPFDSTGWTLAVAMGAGMMLLTTVTLVFDLAALYWLGSWLGLRSGRATGSAMRALLYAQILPALLFCIPGILFDIVFIFWSRGKLRTEFRDWASRPVGVETGTRWSLSNWFKRLPPVIEK